MRMNQMVTDVRGARRCPRPGVCGSSLLTFPQAPAGTGDAHWVPLPGPGLSPSWSEPRPLPSPPFLARSGHLRERVRGSLEEQKRESVRSLGPDAAARALA